MNDLPRSILGTLLCGIGNPADFSPEDFPASTHRAVLHAMQRLGGPVSLPLVADSLHRTDPGIVSNADLARLMEYAVSEVNLPALVKAMKEQRVSRNFLLASERLLEHAANKLPPSDARPILDQLASLASPSGARGATHVRDGLAEVFTRGELPSVPLGINRLVDLRIVPGNLAVVGARPGVGKTAMLGTWALSAARAGWRALLVSLEMTSLEIRQRLLAGAAEVSLDTVLKAEYSPAISAGVEELSRFDLWLEDESSGRLDLETIGDLVRGFAAHNSVVLVDYLQLVRTRERYERRYELIGHVCRELKHLAVTHHVPIIVAAQLSRAAEQHSRPQLSDLRESGEIEQTADKVLFIDRDDDGCRLAVAKNRNGRTFNCSVRFVGEQCRFEDPDGI